MRFAAGISDQTDPQKAVEAVLKQVIPQLQGQPATEALQKLCVDVRMIRKATGPDCPIAGFFCNGEIGPIGPHNYIHGFTSSLGLFRPRSTDHTG